MDGNNVSNDNEERENNPAKEAKVLDIVDLLNRRGNESFWIRLRTFVVVTIVFGAPAAVILLNKLTEFSWIWENLAHALDRVAVAFPIIMTISIWVMAMSNEKYLPKAVKRSAVKEISLERNLKTSVNYKWQILIVWVTLLTYLAAAAWFCAICTIITLYMMASNTGNIQKQARKELDRRRRASDLI